MKNFLIMGGVLFLVCGIAAASLAFVYSGTKEKIAQQVVAEMQEALKKVMPEADEFKEIVTQKQWVAKRSGNEIGAVLAFLAKGYGGPVSIVVGLDLEKKITGIRILTHTETPGLGAKIVTPAFLEQFKGQSAATLRLKKEDPQNGAIDAITAATISSRAVTNAVHDAVTTLP